MPTHSKIALAALALVLSCAPVFAQGDTPDDPPAAPDSAGGMHRGGQGRDGGGWGRGRDGGQWGDRDGFRRGGFGGGRGMGMRGRGGRGMGGREFGLGRILSDPAIREQVGVSADQVAKIRQQDSDFRKTAIRSRADLQIKQIDLRELMSADKPDRAAIDAKLTEISTARLAFQKSAVTYRLNSRDALTPEQRQKLQQVLRDRRQNARGPGGRGPGAGARGGRRGAGQPPKPPASTPAAPPANQ